ncbi:hypothetical protein PtrM4_124000 [Pyrenophora tritici-repentis]|uniref:AAA-like domain protein n=1 Tax=Pyrenophora tritici-repentis TaxID=45151 RepID=A0A834VN13_9PLEO|nr:hypothetical protein PtrM4_124000 [Pyrenophora tritici-repentis]
MPIRLIVAESEKHAMYVQDLYAILHALWVDDTKPLHGFIRVQISLLLLLSAATATRPGAIVESASAKGSNKALSFKNIELLKVRSVVDPSRSTIVANVNLENVKNKEKDGKPKKFTFRLEGTPAFCIVSYILSIGIGQGALRDEFSSVREIFDLNIPADRDVLRIKWKKELLNQPFLCDVRNTSEGVRILKEKAFPYAKYRDTFVRLGRVAGFEESLELYQLRRASGRNINSALDPVERNQTMGHLGSTYEKYYTPTHIARDFQSIYFGSPSEALLIESVARMGLSRDRRAPTELDDEQQKELRNDPALTILRKEREVYKEQLYDQGFYPLSKGEGTDLYKKYEETKRKIGSTYQRLYRERLESAVREFHESIDTIEIARQLSGMAAEKVLTLPAVEFELRERGTIAGMLFKPIQDEKARTILMILRKMAIESQGLGAFDYNTFRDELSATKFASGQDGPMKLRLDLLESFMKRCKYSSSILANNENDFLAGTAGSLTIVDLTDPVIDADSACVLFDICLSVFIQQTQCGKIVALDEAHNYMAEGSGAAKAFTEKLLRTVREQRHQAVRVVIATQEPSINTQLLDLCSITMVHRCTSPAWFNVLKQHVAALYLNLPTSSQAGVGSDEKSEVSEDDRALFHKIVRLKLGESLLFCPSAVVKVVGEGIERIEGSYVRFKTRQRVTADGGKSKLAAEGTQGTGPMDATVESGLERPDGAVEN